MQCPLAEKLEAQNVRLVATHSIPLIGLVTFMHSFLVKFIVYCKSLIVLCAINRVRKIIINI